MIGMEGKTLRSERLAYRLLAETTSQRSARFCPTAT